MESLAACSLGWRFPLRLPPTSSIPLSVSCRRPSSSRASESPRDGPPELDKWDQMELKFGRLMGEDPNLTLAKIMARKSNPDATFLDVEKSFRKKKGKKDYLINIPADMNVEGQPSDIPSGTYFSKQKAQNNQWEGKLNLSRPVMNKKTKATSLDDKPAMIETQSNPSPRNIHTKGTSNFTLRKPSLFHEDDIELDKHSKLKIKPNLFFKMSKGSAETFSNITLLKKPETVKTSLNPDLGSVSSSSVQPPSSNMTLGDDMKLLKPNKMSCDKLEMADEVETLDGFQQDSLEGPSVNDMVNLANDVIEESPYNTNDCLPKASIQDGQDLGLQTPNKNDVEPHNFDASTTHMDQNNVNTLLGKPQRWDSPVKEISCPPGTATLGLNDEGFKYAAEVYHSIPSEQEENEDNDWKAAERLLRTGERDEVELISCSGKGFVVSFGSLIGFLPYRNLASKWKFFAFESWLRKNGLDPSMYRQNLSILGSYDDQIKNLVLDPKENKEMNQKDEEKLPSDMEFEDLLEAYDQEKTKFLFSFVGQRIKVSVILTDRNSRMLLFSGRRKENEELVDKKRSLMAKLSVGDVVKCCIKKITYFGIFVEVEGVPALIHQSEVSWSATLDPSSYFKVGQIVEAKVHQLDYTLERIALSLREITPDPLMEALESVIGDRASLEGNLKTVQADIEWADVESLIKELQQFDGVRYVSKGRFFLSPGLAPTFQVYMASMFDDQYKLLARYENKVQEVLVQASLDKEQMKTAILACTNRVE